MVWKQEKELNKCVLRATETNRGRGITVVSGCYSIRNEITLSPSGLKVVYVCICNPQLHIGFGARML